jgi:hypothetical protein
MSWLSKAWMILGLVAVLVLVFVIGKANIINCQQVQRSIHGINDDRLVVMGFIVDLASAVHQKELAAVTSDRSFYQNTKSTVDNHMRLLVEKFQATTLTIEERRKLDQFRQRSEVLIQAESQLTFTDPALFADSMQKILSNISDMKQDLRGLSQIQTDEGQRQLQLSINANSTMEYTGSLSKYTAIVILLIMIGIIFSQPRKT